MQDANPDSNELSISISLPPDSKGFKSNDEDEDREVHVEVTILKENEANLDTTAEQKVLPEEKENTGYGKPVAPPKDKGVKVTLAN